MFKFFRKYKIKISLFEISIMINSGYYFDVIFNKLRSWNDNTANDIFLFKIIDRKTNKVSKMITYNLNVNRFLTIRNRYA